MLTACISRAPLPETWKMPAAANDLSQVVGHYTASGQIAYADGSIRGILFSDLLRPFDSTNSVGVGGDSGDNDGLVFFGIGAELKMRSRLNAPFATISIKEASGGLRIEAWDVQGNSPLVATVEAEVKDGWVQLGQVLNSGLGIAGASGAAGALPAYQHTTLSLRIRRDSRGFLLVQQTETTKTLLAVIPVVDGNAQWAQFAPAHTPRENPRLVSAPKLNAERSNLPEHWLGSPQKSPPVLWLKPFAETVMESPVNQRRADRNAVKSVVAALADVLLEPIGLAIPEHAAERRGSFRLRLTDKQLCFDNWRLQELGCRAVRRDGNALVLDLPSGPALSGTLRLTPLSTGGVWVERKEVIQTHNVERKGGFLGMGSRQVTTTNQQEKTTNALLAPLEQAAKPTASGSKS